MHHPQKNLLHYGVLLTLLFVGGSLAWGKVPHKPFLSPQIMDDGPVFKINVSTTRFLPPAMYGTWNITTMVLKSTAPAWLYTPAGSEIWALGKDNNEVTLTNMITNAVATINVDNVMGDTATFHHLASDASHQFSVLEVPTITVHGDQLTGINHQKLMLYRHGKLEKTYYLDIQLVGNRLTGAKVTFGNPDAPTHHDFEVAPVQFEDK